MAQVSKRILSKEVEKRMMEVFSDSISWLKTHDDIEDFLQDFLSPVEKIMLAKRLSIAILLSKGYSYPSIENTLRVTPSTIAAVSIRLKYAGKGYKKMVEKIAADRRTSEFWEKIDDFLINIPRSKGSSVRHTKREYYKNKLNNKKSF